uniref:Uncharacterized protein LOC110202211 n=1 Tax=Phascolarctos cinereus TaxID=38626 RepID=A0A6P5JKP8_PHACI|nr:uncharacterized protein LOC110202211 [Phascolarctos cinereus]
MESLRSSNIIKSAKESQKPNLGLPTELCKTENKEKKLKDASPNIGMMTSKTGGKNKVDAESQELNNTLSRETNRLHKSFPEKFMSLRSPGKNKTEAQESICMECLGKSIPEKKANKKEVSPCHGSSRSRSRGIRLLHAARVAPKIKLKEEKKPAKVQKTALRSSNKNKKDTGLKGSNPVSTPTNDIEKDEEKCMGICPNIFKNSLVPEGILCLTRNRNKQPQDINHIPSPTKIVEKQLPSLENKAEDRVEESFRIGSQSETEKELYSSPLLRAMEIACAENKDRGMTEDWVHLRSKGRNRSNTEWIGFNPLSKDILPLGKIGKENILQIFPDKCLNEKGGDTDLQRSANLSKDEPSSAASETTVLTAGESTPEKVSSWKKTFYSTILTKKRRKSKTPSSKLSEPTDVEKYSPESRLLKSVPKANDSLKVVLLPQETQSEPSLLREGSSSTMLKNNTNQTQENDAVESTKLSNDQEFSNSWKRRKHNLRRPNQLPEVQNRQQRRK